MAKLTRTRTGVGRSSATRFWAVADFFRTTGAPWTPANAGYECWRTVDAGGQPWSACMKLHAVPGPKATQFKASITLWPPETGGDVRRGAKPAWHSAVQKALRRAGYRGTWMKSPHGLFGDFWKDLGGPADVRREAKRLEKLEFPVALASR